MKRARELKTRFFQIDYLLAGFFALIGTANIYIYFLQSTISFKRTLILLCASFFLLLFIIFFLLHYFLLPAWKKFKISQKLLLIFSSIAIAVVVITYTDIKLPTILFLQNDHSVEIINSGEKNPASRGSVVELFGFNSGLKWESFSEFQQQGNWIIRDSSLISEGSSASIFWIGKVSKTSQITFIKRPDGGIVRVIWDRKDEQLIDLYHQERVEFPIRQQFAPLENERSKTLLVLFLGLSISIISLFFLVPLFLFENSANNPKAQKEPIWRIFDFFSRIPPIWTNILFVLLCVLIGYLQIGNFQGRLASIHGDDGPVVYSYFFAHPEQFSNDIIATYGYQQVFATIQNLVPALLYKYLSISPELPTLFLVYAQFILLGLSARRLSKIITGKEIVGWLTALFIFGASPWDWNLANYGNVMFIPYAGHLVMPFILFAFSDLIEEKNKRAMGWLFIGGLIHPTLVLYAIGMIGIYWIVSRRFKEFTIPWLLLCLVALSTIIPRVIINNIFSSNSLLTIDELRPALLDNIHMRPMYLGSLQKCFLLLLPLIFLALREHNEVSQKYIRLLFSVLIGSASLLVVSWFGWKFEILELIQLIPQRATILVTFVSIPLIIFYINQNLKYGLFQVKLISFAFIVLFIWLSKAGSPIMDKPEYIFGILIFLLLDFLSGITGPFNLTKKEQEKVNLHLTTSQKKEQQFSNSQNLWIAMAFVSVITITLINSWQFGIPSRSSQTLANYDIQVWAQKNTPPNAMIIDMGRTVSQRASVSPKPYNWYVYNRSRLCKDYVDRYSKVGQKFDEAGIIQFATEFNAGYILRTINNPLDFEELYRNKEYILYKVPIN
jgi:hypothetical protein